MPRDNYCKAPSAKNAIMYDKNKKNTPEGLSLKVL